ncbi:hypothetical protein CHLRE_03g194535v5 [Chlamydomonas reinhardtii]|uniref:Uncharacterized protein n=1 Tax=Chlamydomonas reinhardtii TaxID=3055 RepID=A0A2K3DYK4_CHLRE|nr:uncharacterized protein CHLRE_03g194535v5 [Chlamydomonas reinhardtii]PNW85605.1 hypothetical protein CHLRE_03g194535v5 [Chlamydomonas reinhardtii]
MGTGAIQSANAGSQPACAAGNLVGICNRCQVACVAPHGEPGYLVMSVFEPAPPAHYQGRDPVAAAVAQQQLHDLALDPEGVMEARPRLRQLPWWAERGGSREPAGEVVEVEEASAAPHPSASPTPAALGPALEASAGPQPPGSQNWTATSQPSAPPPPQLPALVRRRAAAAFLRFDPSGKQLAALSTAAARVGAVLAVGVGGGGGDGPTAAGSGGPRSGAGAADGGARA